MDIYGSQNWLRAMLNGPLTPEEYNCVHGEISRRSDTAVGGRLFACASKGGHVGILELILSKDIKRGVPYDLNYAMIIFSGAGDVERVDFFLREGASSFRMSMAAAAQKGHIEIVKLMLQRGADRKLALKVATTENHTDIVSLLANM